MKAQELENKGYKNDKKVPEANCMRTLRTCREEKINRETCANVSARKELPVYDERINSIKLNEIINKEINNSIKKINNSIKDAVQTLVKQYSMEEKKPMPCSKEFKQKSRACQSHIMEKYNKKIYNKLPDVYSNRQTTRHASRQYNHLSMCDNSYPYNKTHEDTILLSAKNKINNEKKNKKSANNVNTDNRRMTGNVNIYICSEAKDNSKEKNKQKSKLQLSTDTSSNTTTEQLNSRCASISSCKLMNSIQEKRKKLQAQQLSNSTHNKHSSDNIVCDNKTLCKTFAKESSESSKEQINVSNDDIECNDTILSIRDGCYCKGTSFSSMDLRQDLSDSAVPHLDFSVCDNFRRLQSWTTIYPSETKVMLNDDSDASLSNAVYSNVEQRDYRKSDARNNICENSGYMMCHAVNDSKWLPKSIYTDCATYGKVPKEHFADGCKYRNKKLQDSILNRNNVWKRQIEYKLLQSPSESCQREHVVRQRSTCSCIAEEEEDCPTNVDKVEGKFPESVYNNTKCLGKISVCRTPSSKLIETATVCEISFNTIGEQTQTCENMFENLECLKDKYNNNVKMSVCQTSSKLDENSTVCQTVPFSVARDRFEKMQTCKSIFKNSVKCLKDAVMYETTFGNSEELPRVTGVCKEFVTEESSEDITVCRKMFDEPKESLEEVTVCKALPDAEEIPKETICKKISDSNFVNQDNDKRVLLNDAKDNLVKEKTNNSNLNIQKKNSKNAKRRVQLDNSIALNNFTEKSANDIKQDEHITKTVSSNLSKMSTAPVESIKDSFSKPLSKIIYSATLPHTQLDDRSNLISNSNERETQKILVNKQKTTKMQLSYNQSMKNHFQQPDKEPMTRDLTLDKIDQSEEKIQKELKAEEKNQDISEEKRTIEEKPRDSFLNRSVKKLIDVIKLGRIKLKERTEAGKYESEKIDIKDIEKSDIIFKNKDKINDTIDPQKISEKVTMPVRYPFTSREMVEKAESVARPKPTAPVADFAVPKEIKKIVSSTNQKIPKLLRIIAAKKSHLPLTIMTVPKSEEFKEEFIPVDVSKNKHVDQEIPEEIVIPQEPIPVEIAKEIKVEELIAPERRVAEIETSIKDIPEDVEEKVIPQEPIPVEIAKEIKVEELTAPEVRVAEIETSVKDIPKDVTDEHKILKADEISKTYVVCPQKKPQKFIPCKCILPSELKDPSCFITKCTTIDVLCPQKETEEKSPESISCKRELFSDLNKCPLIAKYAKCNNALEVSLCKDSEFEQRKNYCACCRLSTAQCTCTQYLKSYLKTNKPRFCNMSPSHISSHYYGMKEECMNCCRIKEECRKTAAQLHEKCRWCTMHNNCSRIIDKRRYRSPINCINCYKSRDRCCCVTFAPIDCHIVKTNCNCKKAMICLYCDNREDKCTCRAPIKKCSYCGLSLDVCNCQNDEDHSSNRERIAKKPDKNRKIRVTSWKPKREIRRYFARNLEDFPSDFIEECHCYEKPKRLWREELPYQRMNIFSDVMNELQQKMSESVCCSRCWRNPCCCGSQIDQDKGKKKRKANVGYHKTEKSPKNKSPNNCQSNSKNEHKNIVKKSILVRHIGCVCKLSPCRCKKNRLYKRPLAKCYYCKNLPCTS